MAIKETTTTLAMRIDKEKLKKINKYCKRNNLNKRKMFENMMEKLIQQEEEMDEFLKQELNNCL